MKTRMLLSVVALFLSVGLFVSPASSQQFPTKPVELVVPFMAGTRVDVICRFLADLMPQYLGQPVIVTNKPGASGAMATADVVAAKPDGYKVLFQLESFFASTVFTEKLPFNPNDVVPLLNVSDAIYGFCVRGDAQWKTMNELLQWAKQNPGKLRWSHPGPGAIGQTNMTLMLRRAGIKTIEVPYKGGSPERLASLMGGHTDATCFDLGLTDHAKAGKLRVLVLFTDQRSPSFPDVPTAAELGYADASKSPAGTAMYVHKGTPEPVKKTLVEAFRKTMDNPEFKKRMDKAGFPINYRGPDEVIKSTKANEEILVPLLKEMNLYIKK